MNSERYDHLDDLDRLLRQVDEAIETALTRHLDPDRFIERARASGRVIRFTRTPIVHRPSTAGRFSSDAVAVLVSPH